MRAVPIALAVVLLTGCATYGPKIDQSALAQFQVGVTTSADAKAKLGTPSAVKHTNSDNVTTLVYSNVKRSSGFWTVKNDATSVEIKFDANDKYLGHEVTNMEFRTPF